MSIDPHFIAQLVCPNHHLPLTLAETDLLKCSAGCDFAVVNDIPRFVPPNHYAEAFGLQWNRFRKTQLDSYTCVPVSRERLQRCIGGDLSILAGKRVLEVGCGAGRFTEILRAHGAEIFSLDLSGAVDANLANYREKAGLAAENNYICQASMLEAPFAPHSFDLVIALGVVQHTPNPENTVKALIRYIKPGGELVMDHYSLDYNVEWPRRLSRRWFLSLPPHVASSIALAASRLLVRVHRILWRPARSAKFLRNWLQRVSPLVDYYDSYPQLSREILAEWCVLDTHDTVTDVYKHLRSLDQVCKMASDAGFEIVHAVNAGNGVELRARRPDR